MPEETPYNPLDYDNLTADIVRELEKRGPFSLPLRERFDGPGVYALYYNGPFELYAPLRSPESTLPIYVGKAVLPGARTGGSEARDGTAVTLFTRLREHARSIGAVHNLALEDFRCRYLVAVPLWIVMAEQFLLRRYRPLWNTSIDGFGNHPTGGRREAGERSWWDTVHPGRAWALRLEARKTLEEAEARIAEYFRLRET